MQSTKGIWVADPQNPQWIFDDPGGRVVDHVGFTPEQLTGGIAFRLLERLILAVDLTWKWYSAFTFFWDLPSDPPFKDVWVPRVGVVYTFDPGLQGKSLKKLNEISLLAGYYHEPSPVPDMSGRMNILDADQSVVSGGIGLSYNADWVEEVKLETFFQAHLFEDNVVANDRDPLYGPISVGGQVWALGLALTIVY